MTDEEWEAWSEKMQADYDNFNGEICESAVMPTGQESL